MPSDYPLICKPFSEERAHETRRRVTPSHVSVFLLGYPPESAPDRHNALSSARRQHLTTNALVGSSADEIALSRRARDLGRVATARSPSGEVPFSCWRGGHAFLAP